MGVIFPDHLFPCQAAGLVRYFFCEKKYQKKTLKPQNKNLPPITKRKPKKSLSSGEFVKVTIPFQKLSGFLFLPDSYRDRISSFIFPVLYFVFPVSYFIFLVFSNKQHSNSIVKAWRKHGESMVKA
jgi:hypothetical protein